MVVDQLQSLTELRSVELAIDLCQRAISNEARVRMLEASDAAQSYRSVLFPFTPAESATIFEAALGALEARQMALKTDLGR